MENPKPNQDLDHLKLLSIFHYVVGGLGAMFSLFPCLHFFMGLAILGGAFESVDDGGGPPEFLGWMFVIFPGMVILVGLSLSLCIIIAGSRLARQSNYTYCLVIAGIQCAFMPFGTVLGVFTIIVLMRPSVRELFGVE